MYRQFVFSSQLKAILHLISPMLIKIFSSVIIKITLVAQIFKMWLPFKRNIDENQLTHQKANGLSAVTVGLTGVG